MCKLFSSTAARQSSLGPPAGCSIRDEIFKHYHFLHGTIYKLNTLLNQVSNILLQYGSAQKNREQTTERPASMFKRSGGID